MLCGNSSAQNLIKGFFSKIYETGIVPYHFILLEGQSNIGKTTFIRNICKQYLGKYYQNDFLYIADLSQYLDGKHTIKVEVEEKNKIVDIDGIGKFTDLGTRQIIDWLSISSIGKFKIVLLENIERMTNGASNAFLKTLEESHKNCIIFGTTTNKNLIIDTILSRAFLIRFQIPTFDECLNELYDSFPNFPKEKIEVVCSFSMNRIGFAKKLLEDGLDSNGFDEIINYYQRFLSLFEYNSDYAEKFNILSSVNKLGFIKPFLEAIVFYYISKRNIIISDKVLRTISMLNSNVYIDNLLFDLIIS